MFIFVWIFNHTLYGIQWLGHVNLDCVDLDQIIEVFFFTLCSSLCIKTLTSIKTLFSFDRATYKGFWFVCHWFEMCIYFLVVSAPLFCWNNKILHKPLEKSLLFSRCQFYHHDISECKQCLKLPSQRKDFLKTHAHLLPTCQISRNVWCCVWFLCFLCNKEEKCVAFFYLWRFTVTV